MATARRNKKDDPWRSRIVDSGEALASELVAHPSNPRHHPLDQRAAMSAELGRVGWVARVVVNRTTGRIIDGHMRVELAAQRGEKVPVDYVELTEAEEAEVLSLFDPIGNMATFDADLMADLTASYDVGPELQSALQGLVSFEPDEAPVEPTTVTLKPLSRAHILVSIPLDIWDDVAPLLDQIGEYEGVEVNSTVN